MSNLTALIFTEELMETFEHYQRAFNATLLLTANGSQDEPIHLEMDIMGNKIAVAPPLQVQGRLGSASAFVLILLGECGI